MSSDAPNSIETIVCLANSRKISGRCVAGKRTGDNSWFRPISNRAGHEISELDRRYSDGKTAQLLDVIEIPCIEERPHGHQSENVLIDDRFYWEKKGNASWDDVLELVEQRHQPGDILEAARHRYVTLKVACDAELLGRAELRHLLNERQQHITLVGIAVTLAILVGGLCLFAVLKIAFAG